MNLSEQYTLSSTTPKFISAKAVDPFLSYEFLAALEATHAVNAQSGWQSQHITKCNDFFLPTYIKQHSYGEYVFDMAWAEAYQRHGLNYYPKMVSAIPFTPIANPKHIGTLNSEDVVNLVDFGKNHCHENNLSGWHLNFIPLDFAMQLKQHGFAIRQSVQFEWFNQGYSDFELYLSRFTARKRKQIKKERNQAQNAIDGINVIEGKALTLQHLHDFYTCYQLTYLKRGRQAYLPKAFFNQLLESMADNMVLITAVKSGNVIACALFFKDQQSLYGRYWGCTEEVNYLHFELCYYQGIEYAIKHQLKRFNPGTQGEHKIARGFAPTYSYSAHWLSRTDFHQAVIDFCHEEQRYVEDYKKACENKLPFKVDC